MTELRQSRDYFMWEIFRLVNLKDIPQNRNNIYKHLQTLNNMSNDEKLEVSVEDTVIRIACEVMGVFRPELTDENQKRTHTDTKKLIAWYLFYKVKYPDRYIAYLLEFNRCSSIHARTSLESIIQFDKELRLKFEQFKLLMKN